jgi:hypothetical protein
MTKEEKKAYDKLYREIHKEARNARNREYKASHREQANETARVYKNRNKYPYRSIIDVPDGFVVHHLNHDHNDNRRQNLLAMTRADHLSYHQFMKYGNYEKASAIIYKYEVF